MSIKAPTKLKISVQMLKMVLVAFLLSLSNVNFADILLAIAT